MTTSSRPEWAEVSRSALALELWAIGQEYAEETLLWHGDPAGAWFAIARASEQLSILSEHVADYPEYIETGEAYLQAARMMLPKIQRTRELHTLGVNS